MRTAAPVICGLLIGVVLGLPGCPVAQPGPPTQATTAPAFPAQAQDYSKPVALFALLDLTASYTDAQRPDAASSFGGNAEVVGWQEAVKTLKYVINAANRSDMVFCLIGIDDEVNNEVQDCIIPPTRIEAGLGRQGAAQVYQRLNNLQLRVVTSGGTDIPGALKLAATLLAGQPVRRTAILIFSDMDPALHEPPPSGIPGLSFPPSTAVWCIMPIAQGEEAWQARKAEWSIIFQTAGATIFEDSFSPLYGFGQQGAERVVKWLE